MPFAARQLNNQCPESHKLPTTCRQSHAQDKRPRARAKIVSRGRRIAGSPLPLGEEPSRSIDSGGCVSIVPSARGASSDAWRAVRGARA